MAHEIPLPPETISPEIAIAQGQREQIVICQGQLDQFSTISHLLGTQNAQATLMRYGGDPKKFQEWIRSLEKYQLLVGRPGDQTTKTFALQSSEGPVSDVLVRYYKSNPASSWSQVFTELKAL